jgi:5-formyltetrahydrofolate cyclo-ligase
MPAEDVNLKETSIISDIRRLKRSQRQLLAKRTQLSNSKDLRRHFIKQKSYRNSRHIACYLANDGEIDPDPIIEHAWFMGKHVYLPVLSPLKNSLYFAPYQSDSRLSINRFNIPEPVCRPSQWKSASELDLLLLPLVAFDPSGNRMGMGGGFYDRTLAYLKHRQFWKKPTLVGLAHEIQKVSQLEVRSWDIPLDLIMTEKRQYRA